MSSLALVPNLALGLVLISLTVIIHAAGLLVITTTVNGACRKLDLESRHFGRTLITMATVLGLFVIHAAEIWTWAAAYWCLDVLPSFEETLYYSTVTFTTLGYGDGAMPSAWRLFAALEGIDGLILIGWSIAYLFVDLTRHGLFHAGKRS